MKKEVITKEYPIFKDFFDSRKNAFGFGKIEPQLKWEDYDRTIYEYDSNFKDVPNQKRLVEYIDEQKAENGFVYVLDVMGAGFALRSIKSKLSGGLSVALTNPRTTDQRISDHQYNLEIVGNHTVRTKACGIIQDKTQFGDVLQGGTWQLVSKYLKKHLETNGYFDLIVCAGEGSWKTFEKDMTKLAKNEIYLPQKEVYYVVMNKLWKFLSPRGGVMCITLNSNYNWEAWVEELQKQGIDVVFDQKQSLRFIKNSIKPKKLPSVGQLIAKNFVSNS